MVGLKEPCEKGRTLAPVRAGPQTDDDQAVERARCSVDRDRHPVVKRRLVVDHPRHAGVDMKTSGHVAVARLRPDVDRAGDVGADSSADLLATDIPEGDPAVG